jgi:hypothetical protein
VITVAEGAERERARLYHLTGLALSLRTRGNYYQGTVPRKEIEKRRRRNRMARQTRRSQRG